MTLRLAALALLTFSGCVDRPRPDIVRAPDEAPAEAPASPFETVEPQSVLPGLAGGPLLAALRTDYTPERTLGYDRARDLLFAYEMRTAGRLRDPYTGFELVLPAGDPSTVAYEMGVNTEHTWPQSKGARAEPLRSDLHHLYPVRDEVNSSRGNQPFGEIPDAQAEAWYTLDVSQSRTPESNAGRWSERGLGRWEPRDDAKGNVARAILYVYALYGADVAASGGEAFFGTMRPDLLRWTRLDPVDASEVARSAWIATQQGTPNPFVLDPTLAERAFGGGVPDVPAAPAGPPDTSADLWVDGLHYDNDGEDRGEGVGLVGLAGARLDGWTLVLYNGPRPYKTVPIGGSLGGDGRLTVGVDGIQNGPADGLALVAPDGSVAEFVSYEGVIDASDGPAAGQRSADTGVAESGRDAPGVLLLRERRAGPWRVGTR